MDYENECPYKKSQALKEVYNENAVCPFKNKLDNENTDMQRCPINQGQPDEDSDQENVPASGCPFVDNSK
jgi:hypothetical protein